MKVTSPSCPTRDRNEIKGHRSHDWRRRGGYLRVDRWLFDLGLSPVESLVYAVLAENLNGQQGHEWYGHAWPRRSTIAAELGVSVDTVKRALRRLEELCLVWPVPHSTTAGQQQHRWRLLCHPAQPGYFDDVAPADPTEWTGADVHDHVWGGFVPHRDDVSVDPEADVYALFHRTRRGCIEGRAEALDVLRVVGFGPPVDDHDMLRRVSVLDGILSGTNVRRLGVAG